MSDNRSRRRTSASVSSKRPSDPIPIDQRLAIRAREGVHCIGRRKHAGLHISPSQIVGLRRAASQDRPNARDFPQDFLTPSCIRAGYFIEDERADVRHDDAFLRLLQELDRGTLKVRGSSWNTCDQTEVSMHTRSSRMASLYPTGGPSRKEGVGQSLTYPASGSRWLIGP